MFFDNEQIKAIQGIVKKAGKAIVLKYNENTPFQMKEDDTPLTEADLLSHKIILKGLKELTPEINILSEEGDYIPFKQRALWSEYWLIDPLDGTIGFIEKTDDFCVCISYIKNNEPVFGLIYEPLTDTIYMANSRDVAYKIKDDIWQQIFAQKPKNKLKIVVGRYSVDKKQIKQHLYSVIEDCEEYTISGVGSALKFCFIAEGLYDCYPALGICSEWDTAPGSFILRSAGGYVVDLFDNPLKYNFKNDMLSPMFLASGDFKISRIS